MMCGKACLSVTLHLVCAAVPPLAKTAAQPQEKISSPERHSLSAHRAGTAQRKAASDRSDAALFVGVFSRRSVGRHHEVDFVDLGKGREFFYRDAAGDVDAVFDRLDLNPEGLEFFERFG